jgi:hypothetical protein
MRGGGGVGEGADRAPTRTLFLLRLRLKSLVDLDEWLIDRGVASAKKPIWALGAAGSDVGPIHLAVAMPQRVEILYARPRSYGRIQQGREAARIPRRAGGSPGDRAAEID